MTDLFQRVAPVVACVTLAGGERLGVTPDHPVWNATAGAWALVEECVVGDEVVDLTGRRLPIAGAWPADPGLHTTGAQPVFGG